MPSKKRARHDEDQEEAPCDEQDLEVDEENEEEDEDEEQDETEKQDKGEDEAEEEQRPFEANKQIETWGAFERDIQAYVFGRMEESTPKVRQLVHLNMVRDFVMRSFDKADTGRAKYWKAAISTLNPEWQKILTSIIYPLLNIPSDQKAASVMPRSDAERDHRDRTNCFGEKRRWGNIIFWISAF